MRESIFKGEMAENFLELMRGMSHRFLNHTGSRQNKSN